MVQTTRDSSYAFNLHDTFQKGNSTQPWGTPECPHADTFAACSSSAGRPFRFPPKQSLNKYQPSKWSLCGQKCLPGPPQKYNTGSAPALVCITSPWHITSQLSCNAVMFTARAHWGLIRQFRSRPNHGSSLISDPGLQWGRHKVVLTCKRKKKWNCPSCPQLVQSHKSFPNDRVKHTFPTSVQRLILISVCHFGEDIFGTELEPQGPWVTSRGQSPAVERILEARLTPPFPQPQDPEGTVWKGSDQSSPVQGNSTEAPSSLGYPFFRGWCHNHNKTLKASIYSSPRALYPIIPTMSQTSGTPFPHTRLRRGKRLSLGDQPSITIQPCCKEASHSYHLPTQWNTLSPPHSNTQEGKRCHLPSYFCSGSVSELVSTKMTLPFQTKKSNAS